MRSRILGGGANSIIRKKKVVAAIGNWFWGGGGGGGQTPAQIADAFETRVLADDGTFEAESCLESLITSMGLSVYNLASHVDVPNGIKVGKIYAAKPTDGSGDLTFTRSTFGYRKNSTYLQEMGVNTPRLDYLSDTCPSVLLEPARTNIALRSEEFTNASWVNLNTTESQVASTGASLPELMGADNIWIDGNTAYTTSVLGKAVSVWDITDPFNPKFISKIVHNGTTIFLDGALGIIKSGNYLAVTAITSGTISIIDATDSTNLTIVSTYSGGLVSPWNLTFDPTYLYVVANNGLVILNWTNKSSLSQTGIIASGTGGAKLGTPLGVVLSADGNYAFIASFAQHAITAINVTNRAAPTTASVLDHNGTTIKLTGAHGVTRQGNTLFASARTAGALNAIDIANPNAMSIISCLANGEGGGAGALLTGATDSYLISSTLLAVACYDGGGMEILDISNTAAMTHVGKLSFGVNPDMVWVKDNHAWFTDYTGAALYSIDISTPATPSIAGRAQHNTFQILESVTNGLHIISQSFTKAGSALNYEFSVEVKGGLGRDYILLQVGDGATAAIGRFFNLTTGVLGNTRTVGSGITLTDSTIIDLGDSNYLCTVSVLTNTATTLNAAVLTSTDGTTVSYAGDITKGFYISKGWLIQSTSPLTNSYTLTTSAAVARTADAIAPLTGYTANIGQTEGTIFFWVKRTWADSVSKAISISDGTANNRVMIDFTSGNVINALVVSGGVTQATISNASFANFTEYKVAVTYQNNKAALFVNGTKVGEDLTVTVPACSRLAYDSGAGSNPFYGSYKIRTIVKTALSDADAQTLTTI